MIALHRTVFLAAVLLAPQAPTTEAVARSTRFESAMQSTGLAFERSASGLSYKVVFPHANERSQTVFIGVDAGTAGELRTHFVYTTVWVGATSAPDATTLRKVFGNAKKLGEFYLFQDESGRFALRFGVAFDATRLPRTSSGADEGVNRLADTIRFVNQVGEETDALLNGTTDVR